MSERRANMAKLHQTLRRSLCGALLGASMAASACRPAGIEHELHFDGKAADLARWYIHACDVL